MGKINSYKDLLIWQKRIKIVFPLCINWSKRASVSVPSNIAEGFGRNTDKSFSHFLDISRGSLYELETQLLIAKELGFITDGKLLDEIWSQIEEQSKMINSFSKTLKN